MPSSSIGFPRTARIGDLVVGAGRPLALLAGPCIVEGETITLRIAERVVAMAREAGLPLVFKASFDKANRTSLKSFRGLGHDESLAILAKVKREFGVPIVTDIHLPEHAALAAEVADLLQIPAFLCRQTDLLLAAAKTGRAINVKKGQWLSPEEMEHVVAKLRAGGAKDVIATDRGTFFGYHRLVNDLAGIPIMQGHGVPVCFDATHSVQQPGGAGDKSGGNRKLAPILARAAVAAGADLVIYSAHKFLGGPTAGIVGGKKNLVRSTFLQNFGIGRGMKVGKESIAGTIAALEAWEIRDHAAVRKLERSYLDLWARRFSGLPGVAATIIPDPTDNPLDRLMLQVDPEAARITAWELADALAAGDPPVIVRDHEAEQGFFQLDPCNLHPGEAEVVAERVVHELDEAKKRNRPQQYSVAERKARRFERLLRWPD